MPTPPAARPMEYPPQVTPYPRRGNGDSSGVSSGLLMPGIKMAKSTFAAFCLTAFALGILVTLLVFRLFPPRTYEEAATRLEPISGAQQR